MAETLLSFFIFGSALVVLVSGIPIWAGLAGMSVVYILIFSPHLLVGVPYVLYSGLNSFALLAIPLFILLSAPIAISGASKDLYEALEKWLHRLPGGLGIASMGACGIFAALCGSSPATAAAIGGIAIPEMRRRGYSPALANGLIAHSGALGILIPPSITMILYGVATETSIGKCFIAGIIPGIMQIFLGSLWIAGMFYYRMKVPAKEGSVYYIKQADKFEVSYTWGERFRALGKIFPFVLIIIAIMWSLYGGWATPSEAAGVGAIVAIIFSMLIYKVYDFKRISEILAKTLNESSMILMIMAAALLFGYVCSDLYVTQSMAQAILELPLGTFGTLLVINILLLFLGCFIPPAAVILMVAPMLLPVIIGLGFDSVWFAVIMTVNLEIGLVTPPVGLNLYIVKNISPDVPLSAVLYGVIPFVIIDIILIACLVIWPQLALWLPNMMIG